jgi:hypothetical protein
LKVLRKRLEQHFQKYFWDLCAVGDANNDGNIDLGKEAYFEVGLSSDCLCDTDEWLNVMNDIIGGLKEKNEFPEWYEGLHKALFRANEFMGKSAFSLVVSQSIVSFLLQMNEPCRKMNLLICSFHGILTKQMRKKPMTSSLSMAKRKWIVSHLERQLPSLPSALSSRQSLF